METESCIFFVKKKIYACVLVLFEIKFYWFRRPGATHHENEQTSSSVASNISLICAKILKRKMKIF